MLTLSRRVVVMDFGIARNLREMQADTIAGTPGPCRLNRRPDFRWMRAPMCSRPRWSWQRWCRRRRSGTDDSRKRLWADLREDPPRVPPDRGAQCSGGRCAAPEGRYPSAGALARALEFEQRALVAPSRVPIPVCCPTQEDARFFFGRELEVGRCCASYDASSSRDWPVRRRQGSFLRAGVLPALPAGWSALTCTQIDPSPRWPRPWRRRWWAMARPCPLPRFEDPGTAILLARRWRQRHGTRSS